MLKEIRSTIGRWLGFKKLASNVAALQSWQERYAKLRATYDAARNGDEYRKIWENADSFDADSAHSKEVRHKLIARSRYEVANNGFSDGISSTAATDLIGCGPSLRMQTTSDKYNEMVEMTWYRWCKAVQFRRKLWTLAHAKHVDGEGFAVMRRNPRVRHQIPLDLVLYEAEQVQTPYMPFDEPGKIDGIKFDEFGNPLWYEVLHEHPGATSGLRFDLDAERVQADRMLHWFKMRRPGQHRGVPEMASTLNTGAAARRWREATLAAAETAADFTLFLKTQFQPDSEEMQYAADFSQQEITKRMMTALPIGYEPFQMKAEQPTTGNAEFHKGLINEQARPKSMPYNKAACDSSSYNYASGRLDHQTYYAALDVEREDCNDLVLDPLFDVWYDLAVVRFGWLGGNPEAIGRGAREHIWDWPKHRVADVEAEANANETALKSGQKFLHRLYTDAGYDLTDDIAAAAQSFGVTPEEIQKRLLDITLPLPKQVEQKPQAATDEAIAALFQKFEQRSLAKVNGGANGHAHQ